MIRFAPPDPESMSRSTLLRAQIVQFRASILTASSLAVMCSKHSVTSCANVRMLSRAQLTDLPDDVLLRVLSHIGTAGEQIEAGYNLASLCSRFRQLHRTHFLPSITTVSSTTLNALKLDQPSAVRDALISFFSCTVNLRELKLAGCSALLSPECFAAVSKASATTLKHVNLAHCSLSDACLAPLLQCTSLTTLVLVSCHGLTGTVFQRNTCTAPLRSLDLSWAQSLTADGVRAIASLQTVEILMLKGCEIICSRSLRIFATSPIRFSLTEIHLSCCPVRDDALFDFVRAAPNIKTVVLAQFTANLWPTGDFTAAGLNRLRLLYPKLKIQLGM